METTVGIQKCNEYNVDQVYATLKKIMDLVPPPDVTGKTVLIKPNILTAKRPEFAVCTHPVVVGAAVKLFVERGAKRVLVGESPATANPTQAAKATGMYATVITNGGEWVDFSGLVTVPCESGKLVKSLEFAAPFEQADVLVSLSKLKSHQLMSYTGAMKNLFGLIVGLKKAQTHYRFSDKRDFAVFLTDLNIAAKPAYSIMDAIIGMDGPGGPGNGNPIQLGFLAASQNILALDWICSSAVGYNPTQVLNLQDALSRKIWLTTPDEIKTVGNSLDDIRSTTFKIVKDTSATINLQKMLPAFINTVATIAFIKTPRFNTKKCAKCGKCIEICPAHLLSFAGEDKKKHVVMSDRKKCLHCFCCHEICPVEAIALKHL